MKAMKPTRRQRPPRVPSSTLLTNPFQLGFGFLWVFTGAYLFATRLDVPVTPVQHLPHGFTAVWAAVLMLGGLCMIFGILWRRQPSTGRAIERAGCYLIASAYLSVGVVVLGINATLWVPLLKAVVVACVCFIRAWALHRIDRIMGHIAIVVAWGEDAGT